MSIDDDTGDDDDDDDDDDHKAHEPHRKRTRLMLMQACYNLARGFHHLGLNYLATPLYEEVLAMADRITDAARGDAIEILMMVVTMATWMMIMTIVAATRMT